MYRNLAFGGGLLPKVVQQWDQWEQLCERCNFEHSPEHIYSEVVWSVGLVCDGTYGDVTVDEYRVLTNWLQNITAE